MENTPSKLQRMMLQEINRLVALRKVRDPEWHIRDVELTHYWEKRYKYYVRCENSEHLLYLLQKDAVKDIGLPHECMTFCADKYVLYAFVIGYFPDDHLSKYYLTFMQNRPPEWSDSACEVYFTREIYYLMMLRIDEGAIERIRDISLRDYDSVHATLANLQTNYHPLSSTVPTAPIGSGGQSDPIPPPPLAVSTAPPLPERPPQDDYMTGWRRRTLARVNMPRYAPRSMEFAHFACALIEKTQTMVPDFLLCHQQYSWMINLLGKMVLLLPFIFSCERRECLAIFRIARIYDIITEWNPEITPHSMLGMYIYLRFFTLTHLLEAFIDTELHFRSMVI